MQRLRQKGRNPNYPKEGILWEIQEEIPDWVSDNFKVSIDSNTGKLKLYLRETSLGYELLLSSGITSGMLIDKEKSGGLIKSKTHPLIYLTESQINLLYDKKKL